MKRLSVLLILHLLSFAIGFETTDGNTQSVTTAASTDRPETGGESPGSGIEIPWAGDDIPDYNMEIPDYGSWIPQVGFWRLDVGSPIPEKTRKTSNECREGSKNGGGQGSKDVIHIVVVGCATMIGIIILGVVIYLVTCKVRSGLRMKRPPRYPVDVRPFDWWRVDQGLYSSLPLSVRFMPQIQDDPTVDVRAP